MSSQASAPVAAKRSEPRERLLATASGIFYTEGIRTLGVERIIADAGVTKATFYRHFPSKEDLVLAYLEGADAAIRERLEAQASTLEPEAFLRAVGGGIADDLCRPGFRGCAFINAAAEYSDPASPVRRLVQDHRAWFQRLLVDALTRAGHPHAERAADHLATMRDGAMVRGYLSDPLAAGDGLRRHVEATIRIIHGEWPDPDDEGSPTPAG